jgi:anaerobic glycerol-3-phosphate dehydrogenase
VCIVRRALGATALSDGSWLGTPLDRFRAALSAAGCDLVHTAQRLPHADGRIVPADWSTAAHAAVAARTDEATDDGMVVCGIAGIPWFRPLALARLWTGSTASLPTVTIALPRTPAAGWSTASVAAALDADPNLLLDALRGVSSSIAGKRLVLPAVLGLRSHTRVMHTLASAGFTVGEALGGSPSLPGWRLDSALQQALDNAAIERLHGRAQRNAGSSGIEVMAKGTSFTVRPGAVVLATGGFVGGGIEAMPVFGEPVMSLPVVAVAAARHFASAAESLPLTNLDRLATQPLMEAGVAETPAGLLLAGAIRAGTETARLGLGDAATDGWNAGSAAAAFAAAGGSVPWR